MHGMWIFALLAILSSSIVHADGVTGKGNITFLSTETSGVFIQLKNASGSLVKADPDACGRDYLFMLDKNHPAFNALYAALLSAYVANTSTYLKLSGCNGTPGNTWALISYVVQGDYQAP